MNPFADIVSEMSGNAPTKPARSDAMVQARADVGSLVGTPDQSNSLQELNKELSRPDLSPEARRILTEEHQRLTGSSQAQNDNPFGDILTDMNAVDQTGGTPLKITVTGTSGKTEAAPKQTSSLGDFAPETTAGDVALAIGSGLAGSAIGGLKGLYALASGKGLEGATQAIRDTQQSMTYQPEAGSAGAKVLEALSILNVPGQYIGQKALDVTGSPLAATAANVGTDIALPLGVAKASRMLRAGEALPAPTPQPELPPMFKGRGAQQMMGSAETTMPKVVPHAEGRITFPSAPVLAAEGTALPAAEQASRQALLDRVGIPTARKSALEGNAMQGAVESQMSKFNEPAGIAAKAQFDAERAALTNYSEKLVGDTGGTIGLDEAARYARGNTILAPLDGLKTWFDANIKRLYSEADAKAGGVPVEMPKTHKFVGGDQADFMGTTEGESLLRGVKSRMKSLGMSDAEGNALPVTVQQAEQLKQYLNNQWQPRTARLIRGMKDAIDDDVTSAAGADVYQQARAIRALRAKTLDDPNGISKIMDSSGPDGINRAVDVHKVADTVTSMSPDQLGHIIDTLKTVPAELAPEADAAIAEIKAHFANQVMDAGSKRVGQWGARDVSRVLNNNAERMSRVFTPEEMQAFKDLNDAGHVLSVNSAYPGAAAQAANALKQGLMSRAVQRASTLAGGAAGGVFGAPGTGAITGELIGGKLAHRMGEGAALKRFNKGLVPLREVGK